MREKKYLKLNAKPKEWNPRKPANNLLFARSVTANRLLFAGRDPENNLFHILIVSSKFIKVKTL